MNGGVVSKETVVLRRWGSSIQKFGFINGVDHVINVIKPNFYILYYTCWFCPDSSFSLSHFLGERKGKELYLSV